MLDDDAIERFSRQILLAEVGGRGQERLGATHVTMDGEDAAAEFASMLVAAAGPTVVRRPGSAGRLSATIDGVTVAARADGPRGQVATLVGRPCARCAPELFAAPSAEGADDPVTAQVLGALVAAEALRVALGLATHGRVHIVDLAHGLFAARPIPSTDGCAACAGRS